MSEHTDRILLRDARERAEAVIRRTGRWSTDDGTLKDFNMAVNEDFLTAEPGETSRGPDRVGDADGSPRAPAADHPQNGAAVLQPPPTVAV